MSNLLHRLFYASSCLFEIARGILLTVVAVILIHLFIATIFIVDGVSMEPNLHTGQLVMVNRADYLFGTPGRGDIVVVRFPGDPEHKKYIKRLIGLPGETVELVGGAIHVGGVSLVEPYLATGETTEAIIPSKTRWVLGLDDYFLVGDNRSNSNDSRTWDAAGKRFLIGKAVMILWPPADIGLVPAETYSAG